MAATVVLDTTIRSHLARNEPAVTAAFSAWLDAGNGLVIRTLLEVSRDAARS
jgi:hypothetical protein